MFLTLDAPWANMVFGHILKTNCSLHVKSKLSKNNSNVSIGFLKNGGAIEKQLTADCHRDTKLH